MRDCGPCRACCTHLGVVALQKRSGVACEHLCERGCGIYDARPQECRDYYCLWAMGVLPEGERPDLVGVIVLQRVNDAGFVVRDILRIP